MIPEEEKKKRRKKKRIFIYRHYCYSFQVFDFCAENGISTVVPTVYPVSYAHYTYIEIAYNRSPPPVLQVRIIGRYDNEIIVIRRKKKIKKKYGFDCLKTNRVDNVLYDIIQHEHEIIVINIPFAQTVCYRYLGNNQSRIY